MIIAINLLKQEYCAHHKKDQIPSFLPGNVTAASLPVTG